MIAAKYFIFFSNRCLENFGDGISKRRCFHVYIITIENGFSFICLTDFKKGGQYVCFFLEFDNFILFEKGYSSLVPIESPFRHFSLI